MKLNFSWKFYVHWFYSYIISTLLVTLIIAGFYFLNLDLIPQNEISWLFLLFYTVGHFGLLVLLSSIPLISFLALTIKYHLYRILFPVLMSIFQLLLFLDTFIYSQYRFHFNGMILDLYWHGKGQIIHFEKVVWLGVVLVGTLLFLINLTLSEFFYKNPYKAFSSKKFFFRSAIACILSSFIISHGMHAEADARSYTPITQLAGIYPFTAPARFEDRDSNASLLAKNLFMDSTHSSLIYPLETLHCSPSTPLLNVLFIVVDSLRADTLNAETMPHLHQFSLKNLTFLNHFSGSNETRGGLFSLFYGLPPFFFEPMRLQNQSPILMEQFLKNHYQLGIFASAPLTKPEFNQTIFSQVPQLRLESKAPTPSTRDQEILKEWLNFMGTLKDHQPSFSFLFFDSLHGYDFPSDYKKKFQPLWAGVNYFELNKQFNPLPFFNRYKTSAHYVDSLLKEVFSYLKRKNLYHNTLVLITSDHGQEFNDNGKNYWGHNSNFSPVQTKVPLVIHWPSKIKRTYHHRTSHYDVAPTILKEVFQCSNGSGVFSLGKNLFHEMTPPAPLLMGYPNKFGIMLEKEIILSDLFGGFERVDFNYNPLPKKEFDRAAIYNTLSKLSRFNRKLKK